jgi:hypothetical protein
MNLRTSLSPVITALGGILIFYGASVATNAQADFKGTSQAQAEQVDPPDESTIETGFAISPVPLNLEGKNRALVGLGSYLVNAVAYCDSCHNPGPGNNSWAPGGNPFNGQPPTVSPLGYMGGGRDFQTIGLTHIITRNVTPDVSGLPAGLTFEQFRLIMRTGIDLDHVHPTCSGPATSTCIPPPRDGDLLQGMPWAYFKYLTDHDLRAIYEYLTAIPCVAGPPAPSLLHNDCP